MQISTMGAPGNPAILAFHALGVDGSSNERFAQYLQDEYFIIMPTLSMFCAGEVYKSKQDEIAQLNTALDELGVGDIELLASFSIGADFAMEFLRSTKRNVARAFFDGPQLTKVPALVRRAMAPLLFKELDNIAKTNGASITKIFWCDDPAIQPYFVRACANVDRKSIDNAMKDLLTQGLPKFTPQQQVRMVFEFGELEEHMKCRPQLMKRYPSAQFPVFKGMNHMELTIRDPELLASTLREFMQTGVFPQLPFSA